MERPGWKRHTYVREEENNSSYIDKLHTYVKQCIKERDRSNKFQIPYHLVAAGLEIYIWNRVAEPTKFIVGKTNDEERNFSMDISYWKVRPQLISFK